MHLDDALSTLFVPHCSACDRPSAGDPPAGPPPLCPTCALSLEPLGPACPVCAQPQAAPPPVPCTPCRNGRASPVWPLELLVVPWRYGGDLARAIRRLKFSRRPDLARDLAPLYAPFLAAAVAEAAVDVAVPVPLHWRRLAGRGFNQADALLRHGRRAAGLSLRIDTLALRRTRATTAQTSLDGAARRANLDGAFEVPRHRTRRVAGKRVLLVDDVVATGATIAAAARALHDAGAAAVIGFALARA